jgi:hypothetical protein
VLLAHRRIGNSFAAGAASAAEQAALDDELEVPLVAPRRDRDGGPGLAAQAGERAVDTEHVVAQTRT